MSQSVAEFVDTIDGVRGGVADAVGQRYGTVADLSGAETASLTEVKGIGPVLAERILEAARTAVIADHTPPQEPDPSPATRARATVEQARAATRPDLDVIDGDGAPASTDRPHADLPVLVERLATLVGTTIGWGIRVYRTVTRPAQRLLHR
jgi:hypothetical protein